MKMLLPRCVGLFSKKFSLVSSVRKAAIKMLLLRGVCVCVCFVVCVCVCVYTQ